MCNQFHRMEADVCNQFHTMQAGVGAHEMHYYKIVRIRDFWKYGIVCLILGISICLISAIKNANLRTDALLNVTRIAGDEAVNTTLAEDLSNCTTSSLKDCTLINNGRWYIEVKNSFNGRLSNYSYFIDNGSIVSCKELRDGDVGEEHDMPCMYYVGLSISIYCLSSVALITMLARSEPQKMIDSIYAGLSCLWRSPVIPFLLLLAVTAVMTEILRSMLVRKALWDNLPTLLHIDLLALVGWISVFSQRHFLITKESGTDVSTCGHVWNVIVRWAPYCAYFPAFFFFNWLLSFVLPLSPHGIRTASDVTCWLTQNPVAFSFTAAFIMVLEWFHSIGLVIPILIYRGQYLEDPRLKENFLITSKLFYFMLIVWGFGILTNEGDSLDMLTFLFNVIVYNDGVVCYALALYIGGLWKRIIRKMQDSFTLEIYFKSFGVAVLHFCFYE